ncbi:cyclophilin-like fold protein [Rhizobium leguminosarum]
MAMTLVCAVPKPGSAQSQRPRTIAQETVMKVEFSFADFVFTATLEDNPSARDLAAMMPLDLTVDDYSTNEKIAYLPRKLTEQGRKPFANEAPGDLCYYAPWGNLVFYYGHYRYDSGLIRLGRLDDGFEPLLTRGKFPLKVRLLD